MDTEAFFHGHALNSVDAKGRVSVPADVRSVIAARAREAMAAQRYVNDREIGLSLHRALPCVRAFDMGFLPTLHDQVNQAVSDLTGAVRLAAAEKLSRSTFGPIEKAVTDDAGRIVLPPIVRRMAGIEDRALFVGAGLSFEIWNPDAYFACESVDDFDKRYAQAVIDGKGGR